jgi:hypothetical protein
LWGDVKRPANHKNLIPFFHPHLHFLVTEGGVDEAGLFYKIPRIDDSLAPRRLA